MPCPTRDAAPRSRARDLLTWLRSPAAPSAEGPFTELDARKLGTVRRFFALHPVVMDVVIALLFAVPAVIEPLMVLVEGPRIIDLHPSLWSVLFIVIGALVLLRRRREPVLTLAVLTVLLVASFVATGFTGGFEMAIAFAIYAVAAHSRVGVA